MAGQRRRPHRDPPADLAAALEVAYRFLATRPRTRAEVARRLRGAGTDDALVVAALRRLHELGYLDDSAFVRYWTQQRDTHAPRGQALIDAELRRRGVDPETVRQAREQRIGIPDDVLVESDDGELARAIRALRRRLRGSPLDPGDPAAMKRAGAFLARRGFGFDVSRAAMRAIAGGTDDRADLPGDD